MTGSVSIKPAGLVDLDAFAAHILAHAQESGRDGSPPFAIARTLVRTGVIDAARERWRLPLDAPLWGRTWLLWSEDHRAVGHVELRGGRIPAELHRAVLAMGIQRAFTAQGHGRRLLDVALAWARDEAHLGWIDLGVFDQNLPARKLYERAGFVETGRTRDAFRIDDGTSVDDVQMTLDLRAPRPGGEARKIGFK